MNNKRLLAAALCCAMLTGCAAAPKQDSGSTPDENASGQTDVVKVISPSEFTASGGCASLSLPGNLAAAAATGSSYEKASESTVFSGSSEDAWQRLLDGRLDVILAYAPDKQTEQALEEQGILMQPIGTDALVFLAGGTQQSPNLTREQIAAAYQNGGTEDWKGYASAPGASSRKLFADIFGADSAGVTVTEGEDTLTAGCPHTAGSLCYTTYLLLKTVSQPEDTAIVAVDGVLPDAQTLTETADSAAYPLQVPYYIACRSGLDENDPVMLFYRWMTSEDGMQWLAQATLSSTQGEVETVSDAP